MFDTKPTEDFSLSVHIETKDDCINIPIDDDNALQIRADGVFLAGELIFWEDIVCVLLTPQFKK